MPETIEPARTAKMIAALTDHCGVVCTQEAVMGRLRVPGPESYPRFPFKEAAFDGAWDMIKRHIADNAPHVEIYEAPAGEGHEDAASDDFASMYSQGFGNACFVDTRAVEVLDHAVLRRVLSADPRDPEARSAQFLLCSLKTGFKFVVINTHLPVARVGEAGSRQHQAMAAVLQHWGLGYNRYPTILAGDFNCANLQAFPVASRAACAGNPHLHMQHDLYELTRDEGFRSFLEAGLLPNCWNGYTASGLELFGAAGFRAATTFQPVMDRSAVSDHMITAAVVSPGAVGDPVAIGAMKPREHLDMVATRSGPPDHQRNGFRAGLDADYRIQDKLAELAAAAREGDVAVATFNLYYYRCAALGEN